MPTPAAMSFSEVPSYPACEKQAIASSRICCLVERPAGSCSRDGGVTAGEWVDAAMSNPEYPYLPRSGAERSSSA